MNEYSENYEKEVNLLELMFYCLKNWRWILISMIVVAVASGMYKYQSIVKSNQAKEQQAGWEEYGLTEPVDSIKNPNVGYYEQAIASHEQELAKQEVYLRDSVVMQLDANHLQMGTLSFYLDVEDENSRDSLLDAYRAYVTDGRLAQKIVEIDEDIPIVDLQHLLSFNNGSVIKNTNMGLDGNDNSVNLAIENTFVKEGQSNVFQIQILIPEESTCAIYLKAIEEAIVTYGLQLESEVAEHHLNLLGSTQVEKADEDIREYQEAILFSYKTVLKNLKTLKSDLKDVQDEEGSMIVFKKDEPAPSAIKFVIVGLVLGAFLEIFILALLYLLSGKLQNIETFQEEYGMPLIGDIKEPVKKRRLFGFVDVWIYRMEQGAYANIPRDEQMRIVVASFQGAVKRASQKEDLKKIMLAGTIAKKEVTELCNCLKEKTQGITLSPYKQIVFDAEALEKIGDYDAIIFVEKKGMSYSKLIKKEKELAYSRNAKVLGAITL